MITTIILDWAGTTVDFGSFAPVDAFVAAFEAFGITPTMDETRAPMGMQKRMHIEQMLAGERLSQLWRQKHGREYTQDDINQIYDKFEPALFSTLDQHAELLPGVQKAVSAIRKLGIKIGSTTGYTRAMMDIVVPSAKENGYEPDAIVCPDEVGGVGRPYPYMLWRNLEYLGTKSIRQVVKVGDTVADMEEGKNAGCITIGIIEGSSMLGLSRDELDKLDDNERLNLYDATRRKYVAAGAACILNNIAELPKLVQTL